MHFLVAAIQHARGKRMIVRNLPLGLERGQHRRVELLRQLDHIIHASQRTITDHDHRPTRVLEHLQCSSQGIRGRQHGAVTEPAGRRVAPPGIRVWNPAFDVTPAELIEALICEHGVIRPVTRERIAEVLGGTG